MNKHKHYDVVVAWANGEPVQLQDAYGVWQDVDFTPSWDAPCEYRVKPRTVTKWLWVFFDAGRWVISCRHMSEEEVGNNKTAQKIEKSAKEFSLPSIRLIPHMHKEAIIAWASGEEIQVLEFGHWRTMPKTEIPLWYEMCEYRVKPKNTVKRWLWLIKHTHPSFCGPNPWFLSRTHMSEEEVMFAYRGWYSVFRKLEETLVECDE